MFKGTRALIKDIAKIPEYPRIGLQHLEPHPGSRKKVSYHGYHRNSNLYIYVCRKKLEVGVTAIGRVRQLGGVIRDRVKEEALATGNSGLREVTLRSTEQFLRKDSITG